MSLSDCDKCWENLCHCGHKYRNLSVSDRVFFASAMLGVPKHAIEEVLAGIIPETHPMKEEK